MSRLLSQGASESNNSCYRRGCSLVVITTMKMMLLFATTPSESALARSTTATPPSVAAVTPPSVAAVPVITKWDNSTSDMRGTRDVTEAGQPCMPSPLWQRKVDPSEYEFGCGEIEDMLSGPQTFIGNGMVRDVSSVEYNGKTVAVKTLREADGRKRQMAYLDKHNREMLTQDALAGHRNIVGMLGLCGTTMVTEYYSHSFLEVMFRQGQQLPIDKVVSMALDAARGLQALHEVAGCLHIDLKPRQLLVDDIGRVMLNDFNSVHPMSIDPTDGTYCPSQMMSKRNRLTPWPSPESYAGKPLTDKSDIYRLGMIFFSLIAGQLPYGGDQERLKAACSAGARPEIDTSWHRGFMKVVQEMWAKDPVERPSAGQVVARLEYIQEEELGLSPGSS